MDSGKYWMSLSGTIVHVYCNMSTVPEGKFNPCTSIIIIYNEYHTSNASWGTKFLRPQPCKKSRVTFRKDLPKNVNCSNQSNVAFSILFVVAVVIVIISFFVSSSCSSFDLFITPLELLLSDSALLIINIERKVPNLFLSPPQPEDVRQILNPFPPMTDSSTSVFWKLSGGGIKILILSSEDDLVWKDPDFNPGSLDEIVSKRDLLAKSSRVDCSEQVNVRSLLNP